MQFKNKNWKAFDRGFRCFEKGGCKDNNPYLKGTHDSAQWKDGFYTALEVKKKKRGNSC